MARNTIFDVKMGAIGALFMGTVVYIVNADHGFDQAIVASVKQASYTFIAGGLLMKLCENLSLLLKSPARSILLAVVVATTLSATLTFVVHSFKGTPKPVFSTLITIAFAVPGFWWWARRKRRG